MLTIIEQKFLQDKDLTGFAPGYSIIKSGEYLFKASGIRENNIITTIKLDNKTFELEGFTQFLYIYEWEILEYLLLSNLSKNCKFGVGGIVKRENGTGNLRVLSTITK